MNSPDPLRIFSPDQNGDDSPSRRERSIKRDLDRIAGVADAKTVSITLGQMVPLLIDAVEKNRLWLNDFSDEPVAIDADLYEVLLAYQRMRLRDAA